MSTLIAISIDVLPLVAVYAAFLVGAAATPYKLAALVVGWFAWTRVWSLVYAYQPHVRGALDWRRAHRRALGVLRIAALGAIVALYAEELGLGQRSGPGDAAAERVADAIPTIVRKDPASDPVPVVGPDDPGAPLPFAVTRAGTLEADSAQNSDRPLPFSVTGTRGR